MTYFRSFYPRSRIAREARLFLHATQVHTARRARDHAYVQIVELTHVIALENMRGRFNLALGIGAAGFSAGMVCAVPTTIPGQRQEAQSRSSGRGLEV
jgi:hypothetical protein